MLYLCNEVEITSCSNAEKMIKRSCPLNLQFTLTEDDFIHFNLYHIHESSSTSRTLKIQRFSVPIIYMIFSFVFSKIADIPYVFMLVPFFLVSMIWVFLYPKYIKRKSSSSLKKSPTGRKK
jgi:hypothetical protein